MSTTTSTTTVSPVLPVAQEAQLILQATAQILASFATPLTLANWPLYVFEAVSIVYSAVEMSITDRKGVVESILQNVVDSSTVLTAAEKQELDAIIQQTTSAAVDALLKANSVVDTWVEVEAKSCWSRFKSWWVKHCCCCGSHVDDAVADHPSITQPPPPTTTATHSASVQLTPVASSTPERLLSIGTSPATHTVHLSTLAIPHLEPVDILEPRPTDPVVETVEPTHIEVHDQVAHDEHS
jgi:hypothetical protein